MEYIPEDWKLYLFIGGILSLCILVGIIYFFKKSSGETTTYEKVDDESTTNDSDYAETHDESKESTQSSD